MNTKHSVINGAKGKANEGRKKKKVDVSTVEVHTAETIATRAMDMAQHQGAVVAVVAVALPDGSCHFRYTGGPGMLNQVLAQLYISRDKGWPDDPVVQLVPQDPPGVPS